MLIGYLFHQTQLNNENHRNLSKRISSFFSFELKDRNQIKVLFKNFCTTSIEPMKRQSRCLRTPVESFLFLSLSLSIVRTNEQTRSRTRNDDTEGKTMMMTPILVIFSPTLTLTPLSFFLFSFSIISRQISSHCDEFSQQFYR